MAYVDSTIGFPLFCEYTVGSTHSRRERKGLVHRRDDLVRTLRVEAKKAARTHAEPDDATDTMPNLERHR